MHDLTIGFPKFASHWFFDDVAAFEPFNNVTKLNLSSPSLLAFIENINISFPNLTHLALFVAKTEDLEATKRWKAPSALESLIIDSPHFECSWATVYPIITTVQHDLRLYPWLLRLPNTVHTLHLRSFFSYAQDYSMTSTNLRWPSSLAHLTIGGGENFWGIIDPQPQSEIVEKEIESQEPVLSREEYAKAARAAKKAGETPTPKPNPTPAKECAPYLQLPPTVLTIQIVSTKGMPSPEPDALPPRIRSLRGCGPGIAPNGARFPLPEFYKARPSLQVYAWGDTAAILHNGGTTQTNIEAMKLLPCYVQTMGVCLHQRWITIKDFTKHMPPSVTEMDILHEPKPDDTDSGPPTETIPLLPPGLKTLRLQLKDAINIKLPPTLTSLDVCSSRLKSATVFPPTLMHYSTQYHHSADLTVFPSCLTSLSLVISFDHLNQSQFAARNLPRNLQHLHIRFTFVFHFSSKMIEWWSGMSKDLPLETLSLCYSDYQTGKAAPYSTLKEPFPMPYIHPTIYKLAITVYDLPLAISTHILSQLPKHLVMLSLGVFNTPVRPCPTVPSHLVDQLPSSLAHLRTTVFDLESLKKWHKEQAAKEGRPFVDSALDAPKYTYIHLSTFPGTFPAGI